MLKVYTSYNCSSCKKAMSWLNKNGIGYDEYNFFTKGLDEDELSSILKYAKNGFADIISERSTVYAKYKDEMYDMSTPTLIKFIIENPAVLKRPIIVDDVTKSLLIGFNENDMEDLI